MSEAELLDQIAKLAGAINRHKNAITKPSTPSVVSSFRPSSSSYGVAKPTTSYRHQNRQWTNNNSSNDNDNNNNNNDTTSNSTSRITNEAKEEKIVRMDGVKYKSSRNGTKLVRLDGKVETPKKAVLGGVPYFRSKNGNLLAKRPCPYFTRTGNCQTYPIIPGNIVY
jgi:hypothetical protein